MLVSKVKPKTSEPRHDSCLIPPYSHILSSGPWVIPKIELQDTEVRGAQQRSAVSAPQHKRLTWDMSRSSGERTASEVDPAGRHRASPRVRETSLELRKLKREGISTVMLLLPLLLWSPKPCFAQLAANWCSHSAARMETNCGTFRHI